LYFYLSVLTVDTSRFQNPPTQTLGTLVAKAVDMKNIKLLTMKINCDKLVLNLTLILTFCVTLSGCVNYSITTDSFYSQMTKNQVIGPAKKFQGFTFYKYSTNNIDSIKCTDSKNNPVWLFINKDTYLFLYIENEPGKRKVFFDTAILKGDTISGYDSRIAANKYTVSTKKIKKIAIHVEFPKTKPAQN